MREFQYWGRQLPDGSGRDQYRMEYISGQSVMLRRFLPNGGQQYMQVPLTVFTQMFRDVFGELNIHDVEADLLRKLIGENPSIDKALAGAVISEYSKFLGFWGRA